MINAFINIKRFIGSALVAYQFSDGFKQFGICVEIDRVLYRLKDSPALWYNEFAGILRKLDLTPYKKKFCIFIDAAYKVFILFFIDNVQVIYYRSDKFLALKITSGFNNAYELRDIGNTE